jgi:hypothetical protein
LPEFNFKRLDLEKFGLARPLFEKFGLAQKILRARSLREFSRCESFKYFKRSFLRRAKEKAEVDNSRLG